MAPKRCESCNKFCAADKTVCKKCAKTNNLKKMHQAKGSVGFQCANGCGKTVKKESETCRACLAALKKKEKESKDAEKTEEGKKEETKEEAKEESKASAPAAAAAADGAAAEKGETAEEKK